MNIGKNENELTFLIVDDQKDILTLCHALIQDAFNFKKVFTASNGDEARRLIKVNQIDIVLSDIRMPGLDGLELLKKVSEKGIHIPVYIFMTGFNDKETARKAYELGALAVIDKPLNHESMEIIREKIS